MDAIADDSSDTDGSHVSATPPRSSHCSPTKKSTTSVSPLKKCNKRRKPQSIPTKPSDQDLPPFPAADLSNLHGHSVKKIVRSSDSGWSTSFSSLVLSRRPSFDPSTDLINVQEFAPRQETPSNRAGNGINIARLHPNWLGPRAGSPAVSPPLRMKLPKDAGRGNFVRLNINGYGKAKKSSYWNGKKRAFAPHRYSKPCDTSVKQESLDLNGSIKHCKRSENSRGLIESAVEAARVEPSDENLRKLLKLTHGYDCFREGQLEAIRHVISGESTVVVLPTGAGKSLCYQLPALILPGVALVVSPLVALMIDQLRQLPASIPGGLLCSNQTSEETSETMERLREGLIKVLFVSPERFLNSEFLLMFREVLRISFVAIDEAHCISEWSHNFRPSYLRLRASLFCSILNVRCFLAMTATATTQTLHDIMSALEVPSKNLIQNCQIRENLQHFVTFSADRLKDLLFLMKSSPMDDMQSIIVYCKFQAETEQVSKYLCDNKIAAKAYHSGMTSKDRLRTQELFCSNKIRVVVATVAFGMGLNKSDVGAVIHYSLPGSLEEYIQEIGRAGRDGRHCFCHLLLDNFTYYKLRSLLYSDGIDEYAISKLLSQIFPKNIRLDGYVYSLIKESMSYKFDMKEEVLFTVLTRLEIGPVQYLCLLPQLSVTCTLYFHKTSPEVLSRNDFLLATIISKSETKHGHYVFDIPTVANHAMVAIKEILDHIRNLKSLGEITYDLKDPAFCYMIVKEPEDVCSLSAQLKNFLSNIEKCKVQKLDEMFNMAYFAVNDCRRLDGCSNSLHSPCIRKRISEYFCRDLNTKSEFSFRTLQNSQFLRSDIKVFLQCNLHTKFTPRAVARILHGIPSPAFPSATWSKCHFWGRYYEVDFPTVMKAATLELMDFVKRTAT
ncbi:hypothetical protein HPP92_008108 [Vanilla planifolia]|uniref:DNA 3'-5' helicase n=1 Tax=Vanilla planifolia TaxID=51239 RepID=A0A835RNP1_VANPL|nr:hypothetical protein HPP92_008108 [Vanilla planifolia]